MTSTFGSLHIALRSLQSMQRSIEVASHNISNAATPGYSRQKALLTTGDPYSMPAMNRIQIGQIGAGVTIEKIQRYRSDFLDSQIRQETFMLKGWEVRYDALQQLQVAFNEPSDTGINSHLSAFWTAWHNLATTPNSATTRAQVAETAAAFTASIRETYRQLNMFQRELDDRVAMEVQQINDLARQIAQLNGTILQTTPGTVDGFSAVPPWPGLTGLADGTYSVEIRDNNNLLEFRLVNHTGQAIAIDDAGQSGTTTTANWQPLSLVAGTTFDTGRGLAIDFGSIDDHSLGNINTNINVNGFTLSGVGQNVAELPSDTYYVELRDNGGLSEFRLVNALGNPVQINDNAGSLTENWQPIPAAAPYSFDTSRGLTIQFGAGPYVESVRGGSATPPPIAAANAVYPARGTQVSTVGAGAASLSMGNFFSGTGGYDIALSNYITADYNRIATAASANSPGDGSIALAIAQLQSKSLLNGDTTTIGDFYRTTIAGLGRKLASWSKITNSWPSTCRAGKMNWPACR